MAHVRMDAQTGREVKGRKPPGWGDDKLAAFVELTSDNVLATYAQLRPSYDTLQ